MSVKSGTIFNKGTATIPASESSFVVTGATFATTRSLSLAQSTGSRRTGPSSMPMPGGPMVAPARRASRG
jgi:hypothetical protein